MEDVCGICGGVINGQYYELGPEESPCLCGVEDVKPIASTDDANGG